jgi:hypothetical protein
VARATLRGAARNWRNPVFKKLPIGVVAAGCCTVLALSPAAHAVQDGRFSLTPTEGGFIRLDRDTGAMSFCSGKDAEWACKPMPDGQKELEGRIDQLERENKMLREERSELNAAPSPDSVAPPGDIPVPKEEDVDKLFDYVEGMMKKFKERLKRLEQESKKETPL